MHMLLRITNLKVLGQRFQVQNPRCSPSNEGEHGEKHDNSGRKKAPR